MLANEEAVMKLFNKMIKKENPSTTYKIISRENMPDGSYKGMRKKDKKMFVIKNVNYKTLDEP